MTVNYSELCKRFIDHYGLLVRSGPFAGMRYVAQSCGSAYIPKLIGCYEEELHDLLEQKVFTRHYDTLVNIGCGEGYYAVGVALRLANIRVFAFDIHPDARRLCRELATANAVEERIAIEEECTPGRLAQIIEQGGKVLIICDIEGGEKTLLDPQRVPGLQSCDMIVELHDFNSRDISTAISQRFSPTHQLTWITHRKRDPAKYPWTGIFQGEEELRHAVTEFRVKGMQWLYLEKNG